MTALASRFAVNSARARPRRKKHAESPKPAFCTAISGRRYYSPTLGRFINRDPIEEQGGLSLYAFCLNNPLNNWDHLGMLAEGWTWADGMFEGNPDPSWTKVNEAWAGGSCWADETNHVYHQQYSGGGGDNDEMVGYSEFSFSACGNSIAFEDANAALYQSNAQFAAMDAQNRHVWAVIDANEGLAAIGSQLRIATDGEGDTYLRTQGSSEQHALSVDEAIQSFRMQCESPSTRYQYNVSGDWKTQDAAAIVAATVISRIPDSRYSEFGCGIYTDKSTNSYHLTPITEGQETQTGRQYWYGDTSLLSQCENPLFTAIINNKCADLSMTAFVHNHPYSDQFSKGDWDFAEVHNIDGYCLTRSGSLIWLPKPAPRAPTPFDEEWDKVKGGQTVIGYQPGST